MTSGGPEPGKGEVNVEEDDEDPYQGGGKAAGVRIFLQRRRSVGATLRCRDVGGYPPHGTGPRGFPGPGGAVIYGADPAAVSIWEVGLHLGRYGKVGCRV